MQSSLRADLVLIGYAILINIFKSNQGTIMTVENILKLLFIAHIKVLKSEYSSYIQNLVCILHSRTIHISWSNIFFFFKPSLLNQAIADGKIFVIKPF